MVSIIVPYNDGKYLNRCLDSLKNLKGTEIILINDFAEYKPIINETNIRYIETKEKTIGVGNARNVGVENAKGKYIMFVDADDTVEPNLLDVLQEYINKDIDMIKYQMKIINNKNILKAEAVGFGKTTGEKAFNRMCFKDKYLDSPCLYLIKRELISQYKFTKNVYHEDFGLIPLLIANAKSFVSSGFYGYNYFQTENSIMRSKNYLKEIKKVDDKFMLYENIKQQIDNLKKKTKKNLLKYYTNSLIFAVKGLQKNERLKYLRKIEPVNIRQFIKVFYLSIKK